MESVLIGCAAWAVCGVAFLAGYTTAFRFSKNDAQEALEEIERLKYRLEMSESCKAVLRKNCEQLQQIVTNDIENKVTDGVVEKILLDCIKQDVDVIKLNGFFKNSVN
jgi:hypothetical protein